MLAPPAATATTFTVGLPLERCEAGLTFLEVASQHVIKVFVLVTMSMVAAIAEATPVVALVTAEIMLAVFMVEVVLVFRMVAAMLFLLFVWRGCFH